MGDSSCVNINNITNVDNNEVLLNNIKKYFGSNIENEGGGAVIRFRPPFIQTPKHDARGDAVFLATDYLIQREIPLWAAQIIGYLFVDAYISELRTEATPFVEDVYDPIDASVWCKQVIALLTKYMADIAAGRIPLPEKPSKWNQYPYSFCAQRNRRTKMEDKAVIIPTLSVVEPTKSKGLEDDAFFAVFDGHNGVDCAVYASTHFARCLVEDSMYNNTDPKIVMRNAFGIVDRRLSVRCKNENIKGGTTAVCALLRGSRQLCIGWCGDSAIGVLRPDSVRTLSSAHSPDVPEEARRVEQAGGMVVWIQGELRVNGILNLTRALGDIDGRPMISPEPDIMSFDLDGNEYILMLACDGVWDSLTESQIYNSVKHFVASKSPSEYEELAEYVCTEAKKSGSLDNLTLICVFLRPVQDLWKLFS